MSASNLHIHVHARAQTYISPTGKYILKEQIVNKIETPVINGECHSLLISGVISYHFHGALVKLES